MICHIIKTVAKELPPDLRKEYLEHIKDKINSCPCRCATLAEPCQYGVKYVKVYDTGRGAKHE